MPTIAILYICTGKYEVFWKNFYESAEQFLLPGYRKQYFVFTDADHIYNDTSSSVHKIYQEPLPWPYPTLYRFRFFKSIEKELAAFEYVYFFNSNIKVTRPVLPEEFLPLNNEELVVTQHPYFWNKTNDKFTYERNPASAAYVPMGDGSIYAAGGLNGGTAKNYLSLINTCNDYTEQDLQNNIIALWHDESYLNRYIIGRKVKVLHPGFLYPAETTIPFEKVMHLERKQDFLKGFGKYTAEKKKPWYHFFTSLFNKN
ncbi:MAG: glycosyl transferase family 6 [Chitinophagaceae bacterium]|nr:glycosyl transferase family 6 [Chitinophagaceae bacterium]